MQPMPIQEDAMLDNDFAEALAAELDQRGYITMADLAAELDKRGYITMADLAAELDRRGYLTAAELDQRGYVTKEDVRTIISDELAKHDYLTVGAFYEKLAAALKERDYVTNDRLDAALQRQLYKIVGAIILLGGLYQAAIRFFGG